MKKAVQFGAGNIGRGFLGQLYYESGYHTTYVDVAGELIALLNERNAYPLRIVGETTQTLTIGHASALHAGNTEGVARALAEANLASTAVGVNVLPRIAPLIAAGIVARFQDVDAPPLNFIVCENLINAGPFLREEVRKHLDAAFHEALDERVGFVEASVGRMVPVMTDKQRAEDPLLVCVEPYCELPVDANGFKGPVPELKNMQPQENFQAYVERKLFVHNMSHATAAYLGYLRGHDYIWQAVADERVRAETESALEETCQGLALKHGLEEDGLRAHGRDLLQRYSNKALGDQLGRIAKDPLRKLGPNDRLIGAAAMCLEQGVEPAHVAFAAAAAIRYDHPDDPAAQSLRKLREDEGIDGVLREVCGLTPSSRLAQLVLNMHQRLQEEGWVE